MKKKYIILAIIIGLLLCVSSVKAAVPNINITLPNRSEYDYMRSMFTSNAGTNGSFICYYYSDTDNNGTDYVYCSVGNSSAIMQQHGRFANDYNTNGYYFEYNGSWYAPSLGNTYNPKALYRWNGTGWQTMCNNGGANNCNVAMTYGNNTKTFITYYYVDNSFGNPGPYPLNYQKNPITNYESIYYFNPQEAFPTFTNTMYVEGDNIKLQYTFTSWAEQPVDYIKTGPLLQKTYTRQEYLQDNTFSIIVRMPQQNYLIPIEYYDINNNKLKTDYINLHDVMEEMPQDQQNEIVAQEEYQKDIYQWESGDYSSTIKDTINNSSQVIKWARDLVQYIFDSFPSEVKYAIISVFIVFLICCIIRMIWR